MSNILGIDVSKQKLDVALSIDQKIVRNCFDNSLKGFRQLHRWLLSRDCKEVRVCLEATGVYGEKVAEFLYEKGHRVSVVNPLRIRRYAESRLERNKTDKADARIIAEFCEKEDLKLWAPPSEEVKQLQSFTRRIEALEQMIVMEKNRFDSAPKQIMPSIKRTIKSLENEIDEVKKLIKDHFNDHPGLKEQKDLLETIPGIGEKTANMLLSEFDFARYETARQIAAHAGVTPKRSQSGTTLDKTNLSRLGSARIRKSLFFPAMVAKQHNEIVIEFARRLEENGKSKMQIICAVMRKLLHIAFGVLKHRRPFDPNLA